MHRDRVELRGHVPNERWNVMNEYTVTWTIQVIADSPDAAAREAAAIAADVLSPESQARTFEVVACLGASRGETTVIDLSEEDRVS